MSNIYENITVISGGHGPRLAKRISFQRPNTSLLISAGDSGGDTGKLMQLFGVPPMGDFRKGAGAMSDLEKVPDLSWMMELRLRVPNDKEKQHPLTGRCIGNLLLVALIQHYGNVPEAYAAYARAMAVRGKVYPIALQQMDLKASFSDGSIGYTEALLDTRSVKDPRAIVSLTLDKPVDIYPKAAEAIVHAHRVVMAYGDFYTSIVPPLLTTGFKPALHRARTRKKNPARVIAIVNAFTKKAETHGYTTADFITHLSHYIGCKIDVAICNDPTKLPKEAIERYEKELAFPVEVKQCKDADRWIVDNFVEVAEDGSVRHSDEIANRALLV